MSDEDLLFGSDEGEILDEEVDIENRFYEAKNDLTEDVDKAIESFKLIIEEETDKKTEWGYKSLRKLCRYYSKENNEIEFSKYFKLFIEYITVVSASKAEKGIFIILNDLLKVNNNFIIPLMDFAVNYMKGNNSLNRIMFKIQIKKAQVLFDQKQFSILQPFLDELVATCFLDNGKEDPMKSHLLIELYGIQIQLYSELNDLRKLQQLCGKINFNDRNISQPRVLGIIMQCCGKVKLNNSNFASAKNDFFDAFKSFDESGLPERIDALKLVILSHMLCGSKIDIFQAQEIKSYQTQPEMISIYNLYTAFNNDNINNFIETLKLSGNDFYSHPFIKNYINILIESARKNLLLKIIQCFKRIKLSYLSKELVLDENSLEMLILQMIFDNSLNAKIDQFDRHLVITENQTSLVRKYNAISEMSKTIKSSIKF